MKNLNTVFLYLIQTFQTLNECGRAIAGYKDPYSDAYAPSLDPILPEVTAPQLNTFLARLFSNSRELQLLHQDPTLSELFRVS